MNRNILCALLAAMALSACNTMAGAGKDVGAAGDALTDSAEKTESKM
jgi:predicted small secreted protein